MSQGSLLPLFVASAVLITTFSTHSLAFQILDQKTISSCYSTFPRSGSSASSNRSNRSDRRILSAAISYTSTYKTALAAAEQSLSDNRDTDNQSVVGNDNKSTKSNSNGKIRPSQQLELPWGQRQKWALKDNISKYVVDIPQLNQGNVAGGSASLLESPTSTYVMWRAMTRDIMELAGYNVEFLQSKYLETMNENDNDPKYITIPGALPLIDKFEFQSNGGVSGRIEGLAGIADGTTIQTSPLVHVQLTIPRGYVLTEDGSAAYELGIPLSEEKFSFDLTNMLKVNSGNTNNVNALWQDTVRSGVQETGKVAMNVAGSVSDRDTRDMLVNVGAATAILLGGATAVNLLSHHLTVNVFWV